jgi:putative ABC transport system substrate-binding protein
MTAMKLHVLALIVLGLPICGAPQMAAGRDASGNPRIGVMWGGPPGPNPFHSELLRGLQDVGYIEGRNIAIETRYAGGGLDRLPAIARELVDLKVDVIIASGGPVIAAAAKATKNVPIVVVSLHDPVAIGLVNSLSRPGGNLTGLTCFAPELANKRLELLREALPGLRQLAILSNTASPPPLAEMKDAAQSLGFTLRVHDIRDTTEIENAFSEIQKEGSDAVSVTGDATFLRRASQMAAAAASAKLPAIYEWREFVDAGGLISYGPSLSELFRKTGGYIDKILKGARPGDLPIERPTRFELVLNVKSARALGLDVPPTLLVRANEVIE